MDSRKGRLAVHVGLATNTVLAMIKTGVGILGHIPALLADGINGTSDVTYEMVMAIFMKISGKPADHEHPYGLPDGKYHSGGSAFPGHHSSSQLNPSVPHQE